MSKMKKAVAREMEYKEYDKQLNAAEKQWIRQFYNEYYEKGSYSQEKPLLTSESQLVEARRNNNSLYRDALHVSMNLNKLVELSASQKEVLELSSDELEWEGAFKQVGEEYAVELIFKQASRDIKAGLDTDVVLSRFYIKMQNLRRQASKEKRKAR